MKLGFIRWRGERIFWWIFARFILVGCVLNLAHAAAGEIATPPLISKGPYVQEPGPGAVSIMWESSTNLPGALRYSSAGGSAAVLEPIWPKAMRGIAKIPKKVTVSILKTNTSPEGLVQIVPALKTNTITISVTNIYYLYEAALTGLRPGLTYTYSVQLDGAVTPPKKFKPLNPQADWVSFVAYGDSRSDPKTHARLARQFMAFQPDFILHTGDLVGEGRDYGLWSKEFFDPLTNVIDQVPLFSAIGNHEEDGTNYLGYFHLPGKKLWYSFDAGPAHVLVLDYQFEKASGEQFLFASNDLARARGPWKIVMLHYPVFNLSGHSSGWGRSTYLPLFHQMKVDMVIAGHSHLYERFRPLAPEKGTNSWAIAHFTSGGGGGPLHKSVAHASLAARAATNHFLVFQATQTRLIGKAINTKGIIFDQFEIDKFEGRQPPSYLDEVYPEESLDIYSDIAPILAGRASTLPEEEVSAKITFQVLTHRNPKPGESMEITLTPESSKYYTLEGGSLQLAVPPPSEARQSVTANVRATGVKKIVGKEDEVLKPALVFQAKVTAGTNEIVVFGAECKRAKKPKADKIIEFDYED